MGHYCVVVEETDYSFRFPTIDSSVAPLVWLKSKGIGKPEFCITYSPDDIPKLQNILSTGNDHEVKIAEEIIAILEQRGIETTLLIELSGGSGGHFYHMFLDILPIKYESSRSQWTVAYDHTICKEVMENERTNSKDKP